MATNATKTVTKKTTTTNTTNSNSDSVKLTENSMQSEFESLKQSNEALSAQLESALSAIQALLASQSGSNKEAETEVVKDVQPVREEFSYKEPDAAKMIRVVNTCYGSLSLSIDGKTKLSFSSYGEVKPVLYSQLVQIVNENHKFAETGKFYILDENAVYFLGLKQYYNNLIAPDILDNLDKYDDIDIKNFIDKMVASQKTTLIDSIRYKMFDNIDIDRNKVALIGKLCNVDIDAMVREMHTINDNIYAENA